MKTIFVIIFALVLLTGIVLPAHAQVTNTISLETTRTSYQPGEKIKIIVRSTSEAQISGFNFQLRYDPACLQYNKDVVGSLSENPFENNLSDLLDITFFTQTPQAAPGILAEITFTALNECQTTVSLEDAYLAYLDESGRAQRVPGVTLDVTTLSISIETVAGPTSVPTTPVSITPLQASATPIISTPIISTPFGTIAPPVGTGTSGIEFPVDLVPGFMLLALGMMVILAGLMIMLLRRRPSPARVPLPVGGTPTLLIQNGPAAGSNITLPKLPCHIGRDESNDVVLPSQHLSRQHAQIYTSHGAYYVADLGSKNGTFVNGKRINNQSIPLRNGDKVKFGRDILAEFRLKMDLDMTI